MDWRPSQALRDRFCPTRRAVMFRLHSATHTSGDTPRLTLSPKTSCLSLEACALPTRETLVEALVEAPLPISIWLCVCGMAVRLAAVWEAAATPAPALADLCCRASNGARSLLQIDDGAS